MKQWISQRRDSVTSAVAGLALVLAIAALIVGITAGGTDTRAAPPFGPGQAQFGAGGMPGAPVTPGQAPPGYPGSSGSGSSSGGQ